MEQKKEIFPRQNSFHLDMCLNQGCTVRALKLVQSSMMSRKKVGFRVWRWWIPGSGFQLSAFGDWGFSEDRPASRILWRTSSDNWKHTHTNKFTPMLLVSERKAARLQIHFLSSRSSPVGSSDFNLVKWSIKIQNNLLHDRMRLTFISASIQYSLIHLQ